MDSKMMMKSAPRANCIKTQSYSVGRKMLGKLSNKTQRKNKKVRRSEPAGLIEELRNHFASDEITVTSQESGISSLSSSSSSRQSSFRNRGRSNSLRKDEACCQENDTMNNSYGTSPKQDKLVFGGVYA